MKAYKNISFWAVLGLFLGVFLFYAPNAHAVENVGTIPAGFYQFNDLEIFKGPIVDEPPATIEVIQKNEKSCIIFEGAKLNQPIPCVFEGNKNNVYTVQIEKITALSGADQERVLLSDFQAGDKVTITGWLFTDSKTIRAETIKNLGAKEFHQAFSGTIRKVTADGFILVLTNGDKILVKTPIAEGSQVTVSGVFDKVNGTINNVLSILVKPFITLQEKPITKEPEPSPEAVQSAKPSTLFRNFLKVFGL